MKKLGKAISKSELEKLMADEVNIYAGTRAVVKASLPERLFTRMVNCDKLHPNPDDEFTDPRIGPNYQIVSSYVDALKLARWNEDTPWRDDPVIIEKTFPSGYLLLNGHHRWAACKMFGEEKIRCHIVNLTQEQDIEEMLERTQNVKRAALDFDEVVFGPEAEELCEPPLGYFRRRTYKERLRLGIPGLFRFLSGRGYDIWVYSREYYSYDYIKHLFRLYHARVDGVITGSGRKSTAFKEQKEHRDKLFSDKYAETVHISMDSITRTMRDSRDFTEYPVSDTGASWYKEVMDTIGGFGSDA
ncbi:MAG: ParB/RepB/Spo0J family partition protein [Lachnospiraceae bacterium]|nr:ParB/RepB/Spo0J family partition protein [Lachnospiraceae bacterium]